jgi:hypothetical protein
LRDGDDDGEELFVGSRECGSRAPGDVVKLEARRWTVLGTVYSIVQGCCAAEKIPCNPLPARYNDCNPGQRERERGKRTSIGTSGEWWWWWCGGGSIGGGRGGRGGVVWVAAQEEDEEKGGRVNSGLL